MSAVQQKQKIFFETFWDILKHLLIKQLHDNGFLLNSFVCFQYFFGNSGAGTVKTFNFDGSPAIHLDNQNQNICVR